MKKLIGFVALSLLLVLFGCASVELNDKNVKSCVLAEGYSWCQNIKNIRDTFTLKEEIYIYTEFTWDVTYGNGGFHEFNIVWYKNGKKLCQTKSSYQFYKPPAYIWTYQPAIAFGAGKHYVEIFVDGKMVSTRTFEVLPEKV